MTTTIWTTGEGRLTPPVDKPRDRASLGSGLTLGLGLGIIPIRRAVLRVGGREKVKAIRGDERREARI
eukprot:1372130-Amorphochlora_amoeboformis.AAC.1